MRLAPPWPQSSSAVRRSDAKHARVTLRRVRAGELAWFSHDQSDPTATLELLIQIRCPASFDRFICSATRPPTPSHRAAMGTHNTARAEESAVGPVEPDALRRRVDATVPARAGPGVRYEAHEQAVDDKRNQGAGRGRRPALPGSRGGARRPGAAGWAAALQGVHLGDMRGSRFTRSPRGRGGDRRGRTRRCCRC